jgi:hypothetical protein
VNNQEILDNAPPKQGKWPDCNQVDSDGKWSHRQPLIRSLADIKRIAELEEEKLNMQISLTHVRESIGRISAFIENIEPRSHEAVITFNRCMEICTSIDEMDLPEFEFKGGAE